MEKKPWDVFKDKESLNNGAVFTAALSVSGPAEANEFLANYGALLFKSRIEEGDFPADMTRDQLKQQCITGARQNLGYLAGYKVTRRKIEILYDAPHPVFGPVSSKLSADEIFAIGKELGEEYKKEWYDRDNRRTDRF